MLTAPQNTPIHISGNEGWNHDSSLSIASTENVIISYTTESISDY